MYENKRTPEIPSTSDYSLPKVMQEITDSVIADAQEQGIGAVMRQARERLSINNPALYSAVGEFAAAALGRSASPEAIQTVHNVMVMTHELLRRQGEADAMNEMIASPQPGSQD